MVTFLLIRHGHCPHVGNYLAGRSPGIRLDDEGIREVRSLAGRIRRIHLDEIVSSPLERSVETASVIAEGRGLEIKISDAVNEVDCGEWTGKSFGNLRKILCGYL